MSGRLRLTQEDGLRGEQPGFVLYYPLYRHGMPTSTLGDRRAALAGVVFVAFRARDLMDGVFGVHNWDVEFDLYDGEIDSDEALLYRYGNSRLAGLKSASGTLVYRTVLRHGGHPVAADRHTAPASFRPPIATSGG